MSLGVRGRNLDVSIRTAPDPERIADPERVRQVRRHATARLGLLYDRKLVRRIAAFIIDEVRRGAVGDGITYAALVAGSAVPSWVSHRGLLGPLLTLVALDSYERHRFFLTALLRTHRDDEPPTPDFCTLLEDVGLVTGPDAREDCLELWDHHWKMVITHYDQAARDTPA